MEYNLENDDKNITRSEFSSPITMIFLQDFIEQRSGINMKKT
jgi:hypothetical protein